MESILAYNFRTRSFSYMQFSHNHIANYGASFKIQKVMLLLLKCQIFYFLSQLVSFTQLCRQQKQFSKIWLSQYLAYMVKYSHPKIKKIHWVDPDKNASQIDGQTDRWTDELDWGGLIMFFQKFEKKIFLNNLAWLWVIWKK